MTPLPHWAYTNPLARPKQSLFKSFLLACSIVGGAVGFIVGLYYLIDFGIKFFGRGFLLAFSLACLIAVATYFIHIGRRGI
jgi:hypothetical protein